VHVRAVHIFNERNSLRVNVPKVLTNRTRHRIKIDLLTG
jgi:hypothetical protein